MMSESVQDTHSNHGNSTITCSKLLTYAKTMCTRKWLLLIAWAQLICVCFSGTSITSVFLQRQGVNVPLFQGFGMYVLLTLTYTVTLACRQGTSGLLHILKTRWWKYLILGIADVEANFFVVTAFSYTTMTSVQVLQCFTLPVTMFLAFFILKTRFKALNYVGGVISMVGMACLIVSDFISNGTTDTFATNEPLGDVMALAGAVCYAIENVMMEYFMGDSDNVEVLGMLAMFSLSISSVQMLVLERDLIARIDFTSAAIMTPLSLFVVFLFLGYTLLPMLIQRSSATWYNINALTVNFYVTILGIFILNYKLNYLYFVSFILIIAGVLLYSARKPTTKTNTQLSDDAEDVNRILTGDDDSETQILPGDAQTRSNDAKTRSTEPQTRLDGDDKSNTRVSINDDDERTSLKGDNKSPVVRLKYSDEDATNTPPRGDNSFEDPNRTDTGCNYEGNQNNFDQVNTSKKEDEVSLLDGDDYIVKAKQSCDLEKSSKSLDTCGVNLDNHIEICDTIGNDGETGYVDDVQAKLI